MTEVDAEIRIQRLLDKTVAGSDQVHLGLLLVHSDRLGIHWNQSTGLCGEDNRGVLPGDRYHTASIGKAMTAALVMRLVERARLSPDDLIQSLLPDELLEGLFVLDGESYVSQVRIRHLLNHTSGVGDWFEDKPQDGSPSFLEQIEAEPEKPWGPDDTLRYHRAHLTAHSLPGEGFHYSDTGYLLLGKLIESMYVKSLGQTLTDEIFEPLGMRSSCLWGHSEPLDVTGQDLLPAWMGKREVTHDAWLPADWGGGGVVSTMEDLLSFQQALTGGKLVSPSTLEKMQQWVRWERGIDYGFGLVRLRIRALTFLLPSRYDLWGNWGSISTFMFYNPHHDVHLIGAFNQSKYIQKQVAFMIRVLSTVAKIA